MGRSKVKLWLHHDVAHQHLPTDNPAKYQLTKPYDLRDTARTKF